MVKVSRLLKDYADTGALNDRLAVWGFVDPVPTRIPEAKELLARVRLRGGRELEVKNISARGALLEGESRLLPGTHVDLHVTTRRGRVLVRARILRASVFRLTADSVGYRIALLFEATVDTAAPRSPGQVVGERNPSNST